MATNKQEITEEIENLANLKIMVETYEEIAALRMRKIRSSVLKGRDLIANLMTTYQEIKSSYKADLLKLMKQKRISDKGRISLIKRNGKATAILLSANTGLYGDIVPNTYQIFTDYIKNNTTDMAIIGKLGQKAFQEEYPTRSITYFDYPDDHMSLEELRHIIAYLLQYEKVIIFYGKFQTLASQVPVMLNFYEDNEEKTQKDAHVKYLFEPSLEKIIVFFEEEIFGSIVEQVLYESELAKFASRMLTLDKASENVKQRIKKIDLQKRIFAHRVINKRQQESLTGISLWKMR